MHGIRLRVSDVTLATTREEDLDELCRLLPGDVEQDPLAYRFPVAEPLARALVLRQSYWNALGSWTVDAWALPLTVRVAEVTVGVQWLESVDWAGAREVDSSSWLVPDARGRGTGTTMRRAALALAFGPLAARAAITSAWDDNHTSLRVSGLLGYRPSHTAPHDGGGRQGVLQHLRLDADAWRASGLAEGVELSVPDGVRPLFG